MKIQDILFILVLFGIIFSRKPKVFIFAGIACLLIAIVLFAKHVFFTAERLTWYAAGFYLAAIVLILIQKFRKNS